MHSNYEIALGQIRDLLGLSPHASPAAVVRAVKDLKHIEEARRLATRKTIPAR